MSTQTVTVPSSCNGKYSESEVDKILYPLMEKFNVPLYKGKYNQSDVVNSLYENVKYGMESSAEILKEVDPNESDIVNTVFSEIFHDGVTCGRIIIYLAFIVDYLKKCNKSVVDERYRIIVMQFTKEIYPWIKENGDWAGIASFGFKNERNTIKSVSLVIFGLAGVWKLFNWLYDYI